MNDDRLQELRGISSLRRDVDVLLNTRCSVLSSFRIDEGEGAGLIRRKASGTTGESNQTCSAFALFCLAESGLLIPESSPALFSEDQWKETVRSLGEGIEDQRGSTSSGELPNQYNSSIYLAGYLRGCRELHLAPETSVVKSCQQIVDFLRNKITANGGFADRLGAEGTPSSYLSVWSGFALQEWRKLHPEDADTEEVLRLLGSWFERELSQNLAHLSAGVPTQFDIIDVAYSAIGSIRFSPTNERRELAAHGISVLLRNYLAEGCLGRSAPVLADTHNFSFLCPTVEALSPAIINLPSVVQTHWEKFQSVFEWLRDNCTEDGWRSEWDGRYGRPTGFMNASVLAFLYSFRRVLDEARDAIARDFLNVSKFTTDSKLAPINFPDDLGDAIRVHVIEPLTNPSLRRLSSFSMILYGPPGSSKTTIAKKLAQELKWPFLALNQSDFLRRGIQNLDAEASQLFELVSHLRQVVVLFDEVEEMVQSRENDKMESRLLTTSMLPRIQDLRDAEQIVFVFATNYVERIDSAITRLGRFDIIRCVMPPTEAERESILTSLTSKLNDRDSIWKAFDEAGALRETTNFGFKDLEWLVRQVQIEKNINGKEITKSLVEESIAVAKRALGGVDFAKFENKKKEVDRP